MIFFIKSVLLILFLLVFFSFKSGALVLGCFLLSFFVCFMLLFLMKSWFSLMLFLVYVGALLVLFFYVFSLHPNPKIMHFNLVYMLFSFLFFSTNLLILKFFMFFSKKINSDFSFLLFSKSDNFFFLFLIMVLLICLWIISKINLYKVSSIRPFF